MFLYQLKDKQLDQLEADFDFWRALLTKSDFHHHMTKYPVSAFYSGSTSYQSNRIGLTQILLDEVGLNRKMVARIIAGTPEFFDTDPAWVKGQLEALERAYARLDGSNFVMFCRVQLGQSIRLLDRPEAFDQLIDILFSLG